MQKELVLKENCQNLINRIVEDIHTSPQNSDKSKFITYDVKDSSIIWNLLKGGYDFSYNQFEFIVDNLKMLKTIAANDMWEKYHKKEGYTWGQNYTNTRFDISTTVNKITGDEMYPAIPQSKSVIKRPKVSQSAHAKLTNNPVPVAGISLKTASKSPRILKWYKHKTNKDECCYCGTFLAEHNRSRDHVNPIANGGKRIGNLVWCCKECNQLKSGHTLNAWLELLKEKLPSLKTNLVLTKYYGRIIEAVTYMLSVKEDADLINDPENMAYIHPEHK